MSIGGRIRELRGKTSVAEFCRDFGIHRNTLPRWESGERVPDGDTLAAICQKYNIHADWLLLGVGPKYHSDMPLSDINQAILTDAIAGLEEALEKRDSVMSPERKAEILSEIYMWLLETEQEEHHEGRRNLAKILKFVA